MCLLQPPFLQQIDALYDIDSSMKTAQMLTRPDINSRYASTLTNPHLQPDMVHVLCSSQPEQYVLS